MSVIDIFKTLRAYFAGAGIPMDSRSIATLTVAEELRRKRHRGFVLVNHGTPVIEIQTKRTPSRVYLAIESDEGPTCGGVIDYASSVILPGGFLIYTQINTASATIFWEIAK